MPLRDLNYSPASISPIPVVCTAEVLSTHSHALLVAYPDDLRLSNVVRDVIQ